MTLKARTEAGKDAHDPRAHIAVERVVRAANDDVRLGRLFLVEVPGVAHEDAKRLGLIAAGDDAAVVIREHDDRLPSQGRLKNPLARRIEIVAIDQRDRSRRRHQRCMRIERVTTPQTSNCEASVRRMF